MTDWIAGAGAAAGAAHGADAAGGDLVDLGVLLRAVRRVADLSQRELGQRSGVPQSTVARIEAGAVRNPSFRTVERLVRAAGHSLEVGRSLDAGGGLSAEQPPVVPHDELRDRGNRRYPAHLDVTEVTSPEQWWGSWWTSTVISSRWPLAEVPPATFDLSRWRRDERRAQADRAASVVIREGQWERAAGFTGRGAEGAAIDSWILLADGPGGARVGQLRAHRAGPELGLGPAPMRGLGRGAVLLDGVVVVPDWRRLGVGRRLVEALCKTVSEPLAALAPDRDAARFLEGCGFEVIRGGQATWYTVERPAPTGC